MSAPRDMENGAAPDDSAHAGTEAMKKQQLTLA